MLDAIESGSDPSVYIFARVKTNKNMQIHAHAHTRTHTNTNTTQNPWTLILCAEFILTFLSAGVLEDTLVSATVCTCMRTGKHKLDCKWCGITQHQQIEGAWTVVL